MYRHFFKCSACAAHVITYSVDDVPWQPARTHGKALETGDAVPATKHGEDATGCLGVITYCSGTDAKTLTPCAPQHRGTVEVVVAPTAKPDPDWIDFAQRVHNAWMAFVNGGYAVHLRGANNFREYRPTPTVLLKLQGAGGSININGAAYTISESRTAGVSLHRPIPLQHQQGNVLSFIYHL